MTIKQPPLISKADIKAIHKGNQINRQTLKDGLRDLVKSTHEDNQQSERLIKEVTNKWIK